MQLFYLVLGFISYLAVGAFASWWYGKKIEQISLQVRGRLPHEAAVGIVEGCMLIGWIALLPYELVTNFKGWR